MDGISPDCQQKMAHPFRAEQWPIIQHYRDIALSDDGIGSERFVDDCIALVKAGEKFDLLLDLGELRGQLKDASLSLISHEHLIHLIADWRIDQAERSRKDAGFVASMFLDAPLEHWAGKAWECMTELYDVVLKAIEAIRDIERDSVSADVPPKEYTPLAKLLYPYKVDFQTDIPELVSVLRAGHGRIDVATKRKSDGALILNVIGQALDLSSEQKAQIELSFPNASQVKSRQPMKWFTNRDELNNLINQVRAREADVYKVLVSRLEHTRTEISKLIKTTPRTEL